MDITVVKRDNSRVGLDLKQIRKQTKEAVNGLEDTSFEELEISSKIMFKDGMKTSDIQRILIKTALDKISIDRPNWQYVAGRLELYDLYHRVKRYHLKKKVSGNVYKLVDLKLLLSNLTKYYNKKLYSDIYDLDMLSDYIKPERDLYFNYLAIKTLESRYLIKTGDEEQVELPQHLFMLTAMMLAYNEPDPNEYAKLYYDILSELEFLPATPTLAKLRTKYPNCFSCAVGSSLDNLEDIFDGFSKKGLGSKDGSGFGWDWSRIAANGATIRGIKNAGNGVIPWIKIDNDIAVACDQLGTRNGAINVNLEFWHKDILDFLMLKRDGGDDRKRAQELLLSVSLSDIFMEYVLEEKDIWLFDPRDVNFLTEIYGSKFRDRYLRLMEEAERDISIFNNTPIKINAKLLWKQIQSTAFANGSPFIFFKDTTNIDTEENIGLIRSGNLCMEYLSPIRDNEVTLCNLGSLNLDRLLDLDRLREVTKLAIRMLDNVIDLSIYPIKDSKETQLYRRTVGLGIAGEFDHIIKKGMRYLSDEHYEYLDTLYSIIEDVSDETSLELGEERGVNHSYSNYRNYRRRAIAPTSSLSLIMGVNPSFEAPFAKIYIEDNKLDNFKVVAPSINKDNQDLFVNMYELDQKRLIDFTAKRQEYIDMGISHTLYFIPEEVTGRDVYETYLHAWRKKIKTIYYVRSKSRSSYIEIKPEIKCFGCES